MEPSKTDPQPQLTQPWSRRGDLFSSLAKDLHRLRLRERERVSIAKGVEIKQRGEISYLCARARKNSQSTTLSYYITLHYLGCLVGADRRIIRFPRKRNLTFDWEFFSFSNSTKPASKPIHSSKSLAPPTRDPTPQRTKTDYISSSTSQ